jgi:predicted acetyltransferase
VNPFEFIDVAIPPDGELRLKLAQCSPAEANSWHVPAYLFHMVTDAEPYVGRIRLRVGWNEEIIRYAGHVGYAVEPAFRGRHFAERACRMILPLARRHGMHDLWITCQPDNLASRRTLERLGAENMGVFDVPEAYPMDAGAERKKMCFRLSLT